MYDHSPFATPVLVVLGLVGRADDVKGNGGSVDGGSDGVLSVDRVVMHKSACVVDGEKGVLDNHGHDVHIVFRGWHGKQGGQNRLLQS